MATINSQTLFLTTSPRTPEKMVPEIELLSRYFTGKKWNTETQIAYMEVLRGEDFFNGKGEKDAAFSARDRINRAPKALGFVCIHPTITLTPAGEALLRSRRKSEIFLRQMLKFQIPSPYHKPSKQATAFCVKPYLELLRLIRTMGTLKFDELRLFGMQLTDWHKFDGIVGKIDAFRTQKLEYKGSYKQFLGEYIKSELLEIYSARIEKGDTKTRETKDKSIDTFLKTQSNNMRDYADACFRYLRATGLVNVSHIGKSLSIIPERIDDVDYILNHVSRQPLDFDSEGDYASYLGAADTPQLYTDNRDTLVKRISEEFPECEISDNYSIEQLKDLLADKTEERKAMHLQRQVADIKDYKLYDNIQYTYDQIKSNDLYDAPLMLEWNTWRAMTMLDGGNITANLKFDDFGSPMSAAQGNMSDIVCDYGDFMLSVEVTMSSGQKQYEMESESVSRHLGKLKADSKKTCYGLFIAPTINDACVAHFFGLHHLNIAFYGGKTVIIPLPLDVFRKMLEDSYKATYTPTPTKVRQFFEKSVEIANSVYDERHWFEEIKKEAATWLA